MEIKRAQLIDAAESGLLQSAQIEPLWQFWSARALQTPSFRAAHILYYLGGLIVLGSMSFLMNLAWENFGGAGLLAISLGYALLALGLTEMLQRRGLTIAAGIAAALVVSLTPLAVYGLQRQLGFWADGIAYRDFHVWIDWRWLLMELATLAVGALLLWRYRLPFLVLPLAVTLWYISMDLAPFLCGGTAVGWAMRAQVSLWFGLLMLGLAFVVDLRCQRQPDFAFWLYLFGVLAFWGGLSTLESGTQWSKFLYCCINLLMIAVGAGLQRRVFVVFGGLGLAGYLSYLSYRIFADSVLFPFLLTVLGSAVVYAGILWQRHEAMIGSRLRRVLPPALQTMLAQDV